MPIRGSDYRESYSKETLDSEKDQSLKSGMIVGTVIGSAVTAGIVTIFGGQSEQDKVSIIQKCEEVRSNQLVSPKHIELDVLPEAIAMGGVCRIGETVVPIVKRTS